MKNNDKIKINTKKNIKIFIEIILNNIIGYNIKIETDEAKVPGHILK